MMSSVLPAESRFLCGTCGKDVRDQSGSPWTLIYWIESPAEGVTPYHAACYRLPRKCPTCRQWPEDCECDGMARAADRYTVDGSPVSRAEFYAEQYAREEGTSGYPPKGSDGSAMRANDV